MDNLVRIVTVDVIDHMMSVLHFSENIRVQRVLHPRLHEITVILAKIL